MRLRISGRPSSRVMPRAIVNVKRSRMKPHAAIIGETPRSGGAERGRPENLGAGHLAGAAGLALLPSSLFAAGSLDLDHLGSRLPVLPVIVEPDHGSADAEVSGVDQVARLAAEDIEPEMADWGVRNDRHGRLDLSMPHRPGV